MNAPSVKFIADKGSSIQIEKSKLLDGITAPPDMEAHDTPIIIAGTSYNDHFIPNGMDTL